MILAKTPILIYLKKIKASSLSVYERCTGSNWCAGPAVQYCVNQGRVFALLELLVLLVCKLCSKLPARFQYRCCLALVMDIGLLAWLCVFVIVGVCVCEVQELFVMECCGSF